VEGKHVNMKVKGNNNNNEKDTQRGRQQGQQGEADSPG
jgi:hypothetical protein